MDPTYDDSDRPRSRGILGSLIESIFSEIKDQTRRVFTDDIPESIGLTTRSGETSAETIPPVTTPPPQQTSDQAREENTKNDQDSSKPDSRSDSDRSDSQNDSSDNKDRSTDNSNDSDSSRGRSSSSDNSPEAKDRQQENKKNSLSDSDSRRGTYKKDSYPNPDRSRRQSSSTVYVSSENRDEQRDRKDSSSDTRHDASQKNYFDVYDGSFSTSDRQSSSSHIPSSDKKQNPYDKNSDPSESQKPPGSLVRNNRENQIHQILSSDKSVQNRSDYSALSSPDRNSLPSSHPETVVRNQPVYISHPHNDSQPPVSPDLKEKSAEIIVPDYRLEIPLLHPPRPTGTVPAITNYLIKNSKFKSEALSSLPPEKQITLILDKIRSLEKLPASTDTMEFLQHLAPNHL